MTSSVYEQTPVTLVEYVTKEIVPVWNNLPHSFDSFRKSIKVDLNTGTITDLNGKFISAIADANLSNVLMTKYADYIKGGNFAEKINAGAGNDTISGSSGADTLEGGAGIDTVDYSASTSYDGVPFPQATSQTNDNSSFLDLIAKIKETGVNVNLETGVGLFGDAHGDVLSGIENVIGSMRNDFIKGNALNNKFNGGAGNDTLDGGAGHDTLDGGAGNDLLIGGAGYDQLIGGAGIDTASYENSSAGVNVNLQVGVGSGGEATGDRLTSVENVVGSKFNDVLTGNDGYNLLEGGAGNDIFYATDGDDTYNGGDGIDTVNYSKAYNGVGIDLIGHTIPGADDDGNIYNGFATGSHHKFSSIEKVIGSNFSDKISGSSGNDTIESGAGNDTLDGSAGNDLLTGGAGDDQFTFETGFGKDIITDFRAGNSFGDKIIFSSEFGKGLPDSYEEIMALAKQVGRDTVFNFGEDQLTLKNGSVSV